MNQEEYDALNRKYDDALKKETVLPLAKNAATLGGGSLLFVLFALIFLRIMEFCLVSCSVAFIMGTGAFIMGAIANAQAKNDKSRKQAILGMVAGVLGGVLPSFLACIFLAAMRSRIVY